MVSKRTIKFRVRRKTNPAIAEVTRAALKNTAWAKVAQMLSGPTRLYSSVNLSQIDKETKAGDTVVIIGKILAKGSLTKKLRLCALSISKSAESRLSETKSQFVPLIEEINKNPKAEGIKLIR